MKLFPLVWAAAAIIGLAAGPASAQRGGYYRGYVEYHGYHEYGGQLDYRRAPGYRYAAPCRRPSYGYGRGYGYPYYRGETHDEAVRRIMATYSRGRYFTHPRSLYNEPAPYPWYRW